MKKEDLLLSMNLIDDKYISEADVKLLAKKSRIKRVIVLAACMVFVLALSLFLFVPFNSEPPVNEAGDAVGYDAIINKLEAYYYVPPRYKNNFEAIINGIFSGFLAGKKSDVMLNGSAGMDYAEDMEAEAPTSPSPISPVPEGSGTVDDGTDQSYEEVTDNQVNGVIEADLFKRSDKYIYYLDQNVLRVYSIAGKASKEVGSYEVSPSWCYSRNNALYLSSDCTTVTLLYQNMEYYSYSSNHYNPIFSVISVDVSDPKKPVEKNRVDVYGSLISARLVDGELYLFSSFYAKDPQKNSLEKDYIPYVTVDGKEDFVSADKIYAPNELSSSNYTVLTKIDQKTLEIKSEYALLSFADPVIYATKDSFYISRNYNDSKLDGEYKVSYIRSEICKIDYSGEQFVNAGTFKLDGHINNQYSMDEYEGVLRVFVSTSVSKRWTTEKGGMYGISTMETGTNASLYCVDAKTLKKLASVEYFAPKGEDVKSARFDKNTAYVCTSVKFTDPVFFFDLSDLDNITYKDTGTIEGYSTSLVDFGDGYLLGIGLQDWSNPKIEIYKEEGDKVISVAGIVIAESSISTDYKAYYIDRERGYIGLGVNTHRGETKYVIIKFENENLTVEYELITSGDITLMRGTYIDKFIYILTSGRLNVISESEF